MGIGRAISLTIVEETSPMSPRKHLSTCGPVLHPPIPEAKVPSAVVSNRLCIHSYLTAFLPNIREARAQSIPLEATTLPHHPGLYNQSTIQPKFSVL